MPELHQLAHILLPTRQATCELANRLATLLRAGDLILLTGGIGSGKTTFTQALAESLGVQELVTSPSFVIQATYQSGRVPLSHVDLYRLTTLEEIEEVGWEDYLEDSVTVIEWADRYQRYDWPNLTLAFGFGVGENERAVDVYATGGDWPDRFRVITWSSK